MARRTGKTLGDALGARALELSAAPGFAGGGGAHPTRVTVTTGINQRRTLSRMVLEVECRKLRSVIVFLVA